MGTVTVAAPFRGRGFVVAREASLRYETDFYNEFFVPPATMIGELTGRALERAKVFVLRRTGPVRRRTRTGSSTPS